MKKKELHLYCFNSVNQLYVEKLYEDFLANPNSVDNSWQNIFNKMSTAKTSPAQQYCTIKEQTCFRNVNITQKKCSKNILNACSKQATVLELINAFRCYGYQCADLNPLKLWKKKVIFEQGIPCFQLTQSDIQQTFSEPSYLTGCIDMQVSQLHKTLNRIYCGTVGIEYMHITNVEEKKWIQKKIEPIQGQLNFSTAEKKRFFSELTAAEAVERYFTSKILGTKRFSLEGSDVLIPMLKEIVRWAGKGGVQEMILGMAHRGRLNVLVNVFGKKPQDLLNECSDPFKKCNKIDDVQYHQGFSSCIKTKGGLVHLALAFNPSHLEIINPVVMGSARARIDQLLDCNTNVVLPVTIHGNAAFSGQGVVQETLNMSKVRGYDVGGTIRIVINNQVGFTYSNYEDIHSTGYCTNIARMVQAPIFHVNADDTEAAIFTSRLAVDFRKTFRKDAVIDLICYRRHGHSSSDEPSATQPLMYQKIKNHPKVQTIYADQLKSEGVISLDELMKIVDTCCDNLEKGSYFLSECLQSSVHSFTWKHLHYSDQEDQSYLPSKMDINRLQALAQSISNIPPTIKLQPQVAKIYRNRAEMARRIKPFDWGGAEMLAYATLLDEGVSIRLSGEDTSRGTFFHRHAVVHDQKDGSTYVPLSHIHNKQGIFQILDSVLSEEAVLAFEYGYATSNPKTLVIWEAQFGDFANVAQVVIDQFVSSGEKKWGWICGLVILLPHGYEGQGPEHSSARLERYLQLCAEHNMQVFVPSTPAQIYHILRHQGLKKIKRPLIVMSPKSLLRHYLVTSSLDEIANGIFQPVIGEIDHLNPNNVKRVLICSGKVYYDLLDQRRKNKQMNIAIIRIEQLYPFPMQSIKKSLKPYELVQDFLWCQEEPENQGAWHYNQRYLRNAIPDKALLHYVGRSASASPATGCLLEHQRQQKNLINNALNIE